MKVILSILFFGLHTYAEAQSLPADMLIGRLQTSALDSFILLYEQEISFIAAQKGPSDAEQFLNVLIFSAVLNASGDSVQSRKLEKWLTQPERLNTSQQKEVLRFLFDQSGDFVHQRSLYLAFQHSGMQLSELWNERRAEFAFLENCMGLELFTKNTAERSKIISLMKSLSLGFPYLERRTAYHQAEFYRLLGNDSCIHYFETFFTLSKPYLGKEDPYFLQSTSWVIKADSGLMASAYRGYALFALTKGEIKKAGELLVLADQFIPDTAIFAMRTIENQISLSALYADLVNKEKTLEYALKAMALCEQHKYPKLRDGRVASTFARALMINEKYDDAAHEYERAYNYFNGGMSTVDPKRLALYLSILFIYKEEFNSALDWLQKAEAIETEPQVEIQYLLATSRGLTGLSVVENPSALAHLEEARIIAEQNKNVRWIRESLYHLYLFYKVAGRSAESLTAHERFVAVNDSLYRSGQQLALFDIEAGYQRSLQDETIARLDAENEVTGARLQTQKRNLLIVISGLLIASILLVIVWRLYNKVKAANITISKSVEEKNILLREIHHRVKNNLQVISSLLKLQSGYIKDDAAIQAIAEGRSRVQSMALLHQNLYKEDNLTGVNMKEYFGNLIQGLFDTYNISPDRIILHKNIEEITLDVDTVVPLGLITNELISNSLKHAFPGITTGHLYVDLYESSGKLVLSVRDNGTGLISGSGREGFGSKLIQSLSQKLEADITTRNAQGTEVMVVIREYKKAA